MTKPVIASKHGGSKEIIENNKTGWLVEPGNSEELSEKIIEVFELKQEKKDLIGNNGRRRVKKKFSLELMLDKTLNVYEELIDRKKSSNY
jgi:glycosyltransferase involved in cell wall biosynthesis